MNATQMPLQVVLPVDTPAVSELPGFGPYGLCHFPSAEGADSVHLGNHRTAR